MQIVSKRQFAWNVKTYTNSVDPDETAHPDLRCVQKYLFWSAGLKGLAHCSIMI